MQIWYLALGAKRKITYPLADMQIWYLALGAKRKITYPLADMQIWYLALGAKRKITYPIADMFFGFEITFNFQDSITLFKGPIEGLFENAPKLFWPCSGHCRATKDCSLDRRGLQLQIYI
jgi:hypothetical protein